MPLGFERLNERHQRPNANINFIKPLSKGPDKAIAEDFLSRIAAQCYPVMKKHHILVQALEEYEPNPEFLGRNFNAGEVIQLVLKDKQGRWLSMKFVQMVMMHELAHCKQMNHSRFFWGVRNEYAKQMEELWEEGYVGEGIWGRGRGLGNGAFVHAQPPDSTQIPEHLCGGSYRRRGHKRKRGANDDDQPNKLSYAERQQQRIQRKFGRHGDGESLGEDDLIRGALETMTKGGRRAQGKPRVAHSKRGRELRANAALARFEAVKQQKPPETSSGLEEDLNTETESEWEKNSVSDSGREATVISDAHGHDLVKVCGDGEDDEESANREMDELWLLGAGSGGNSDVSSRLLKDQRYSGDSEADNKSDDKPIRGSKRRKASSSRLPHSCDGKEIHSSNDIGVEDELEELPPGQALTAGVSSSKKTQVGIPAGESSVSSRTGLPLRKEHQYQGSETEEEVEARPNRKPSDTTAHNGTNKPENIADHEAKNIRELDGSNTTAHPPTNAAIYTLPPSAPPLPSESAASTTNILPCPICSLENDLDSPTCMACSHVLKYKLMPNCWRCTTETCKESRYINAGDAGRCGLCGAPKPKTATPVVIDDASGRPMGLTTPDVLRWD